MEQKRLEEIEAHVLAARQEVYDLCHGKQWRMCIPVQQGDSDIVFGVLIDDLQWLIAQLKKAENKSADNMRANALKQEQEEIAQEAWLRERLKLLRFPDVEDVYVTDSYYFYVSFSRLLTSHEIALADATISASIERSDPRLKNRYRVVVNPMDKDED